MLVRLLYVSRARPEHTAQDIEDILRAARHHNLHNGITGILCYGGGIYLQAIEGGRGAVNRLYRHIVEDPRHHDVEPSRAGAAPSTGCTATSSKTRATTTWSCCCTKKSPSGASAAGRWGRST